MTEKQVDGNQIEKKRNEISTQKKVEIKKWKM